MKNYRVKVFSREIETKGTMVNVWPGIADGFNAAYRTTEFEKEWDSYWTDMHLLPVVEELNKLHPLSEFRIIEEK